MFTQRTRIERLPPYLLAHKTEPVETHVKVHHL